METINIKYDDVAMSFVTNENAGESIEKRVQNFDTKEPLTIDWLSKLDENCVLWDVGANIGLYTVYGAKLGAKVYAFEPVYHNFYILNQNVCVNRLNSRVLCFSIGICDIDEITILGVDSHEVGTSQSQLRGEEKKYRQGCASFSIDSLIERGLETPTHLKIDIDGLEHLVVDGMTNLLKNKELKSIIIEINTKDTRHMEAVQHILESGFDYDLTQVQKIIRRTGEFIGQAEFIFNRVES